MKFSLFFEMQLPQPDRASEAQVFRDCVEQAVLADELGYHCRVGGGAPRALRVLALLSAPEVFLAFVAARTERIRLGHGVTLLAAALQPSASHRRAHRHARHPLRRPGELGARGSPPRWSSRWPSRPTAPSCTTQWLEALRDDPPDVGERRLRAPGPFLPDSAHQVIPKPVQPPHPPIFAACSRAGHRRPLVGSLGLGALNFAFGNDDYLTEKVRDYRAAAATGGAGRPARRTTGLPAPPPRWC